MASAPDHVSMALFCDFENVALGVRDAKYDKFDIKKILERLLLKGSIVVKKAYCDWDRYKGFKATMHEANFELIEIPHVRQSGKNSADIRLVVDALDLCYTKSHVNTFVIISGDSDFSPLVSKLRENAKKVIGVGVKQSTSDLLIANCDEFIFYDDLVRESQRALARRQSPDLAPPARRSPEEERQRKETLEKRRAEAIEIAAETFEALVSERGDSGKIWASVLKEAIKRRKPDFSESYHGFRTFGNLLEEAQARGLLEFGRDEKSGAYVFRGHSAVAPAAAAEPAEAVLDRPVSSYFQTQTAPVVQAEPPASPAPRRRARGTRKPDPMPAEPDAGPVMEETPRVSGYFQSEIVTAVPAPAPVPVAEAEAAVSASPEPRRRTRTGRKPAAAPSAVGEPALTVEVQPVPDAAPASAPELPAEVQVEPLAEVAEPPRKTARPRRARKPADKPLNQQA